MAFEILLKLARIVFHALQVAEKMIFANLQNDFGNFIFKAGRIVFFLLPRSDGLDKVCTGVGQTFQD